MSVNLLKTVFTSHDAANLQNVVESINLNMRKPEYEESVIATVNKFLIRSPTRLMALELLQALIPYCSYDTLSENVFNWCGYCMVHHAEDSGREVKLNTLGTILEKTGDMEQFTKKFSTEYLNTTLKTCLIYQNNAEKIAALKCLTQCMKRYPSWFGNHKQKIEAYLIKCLEDPCQVTTSAASAAFISFLETGPAGANSNNYVINLSSHFNKLCGTIQLLYNKLFQDCFEIDNSVNIAGDVFNELMVGFTSENAVEAISNRIINCLFFLKTLITKKFSVEKRIVPKYVFDIIYRGLSAHFCFIQALIPNFEDCCMFLKNIQIHLLQLFEAFLLVYQTSLLPFAALIENILLNNLQRTSGCDCLVFDKSFKHWVYKTLIIWLKISKVINDAHFQQKLVPMILEDISSAKKTTYLNVDKSGKKKMKLSDNATNRKALISDIIAENNCIDALETMKCLLVTSFTVEETLLKEIVICITKALNDIHTDKTLPPYNNITCQVKLYEVFISLFKVANFKILLPSMHSLINVLSRGVRSRNEKISQVSKEGLELLEKISHPVCSTLDICDLNSSLNQDRSFNNKLLNKRNEVCEKNGEKHQKEINIISNIVINKLYDEEQEENNFVNQNEEVEEMENETEIAISEVVETVLQEEESRVDTSAEIDEHLEKEDEEMPEVIKTVPEEVDDEKVAKNSEVDVVSESGGNNGLEDMVCSFIDVVQE